MVASMRCLLVLVCVLAITHPAVVLSSKPSDTSEKGCPDITTKDLSNQACVWTGSKCSDCTSQCVFNQAPLYEIDIKDNTVVANLVDGVSVCMGLSSMVKMSVYVLDVLNTMMTADPTHNRKLHLTARRTLRDVHAAAKKLKKGAAKVLRSFKRHLIATGSQLKHELSKSGLHMDTIPKRAAVATKRSTISRSVVAKRKLRRKLGVADGDLPDLNTCASKGDVDKLRNAAKEMQKAADDMEKEYLDSLSPEDKKAYDEMEKAAKDAEKAYYDSLSASDKKLFDAEKSKAEEAAKKAKEEDDMIMDDLARMLSYCNNIDISKAEIDKLFKFSDNVATIGADWLGIEPPMQDAMDAFDYEMDYEVDISDLAELSDAELAKMAAAGELSEEQLAALEAAGDIDTELLDELTSEVEDAGDFPTGPDDKDMSGGPDDKPPFGGADGKDTPGDFNFSGKIDFPGEPDDPMANVNLGDIDLGDMGDLGGDFDTASVAEDPFGSMADFSFDISSLDMLTPGQYCFPSEFNFDTVDEMTGIMDSFEKYCMPEDGDVEMLHEDCDVEYLNYVTGKCAISFFQLVGVSNSTATDLVSGMTDTAAACHSLSETDCSNTEKSRRKLMGSTSDATASAAKMDKALAAAQKESSEALAASTSIPKSAAGTPFLALSALVALAAAVMLA